MLSLLQGSDQYESKLEEFMVPIQQAICLKALILAAFTFGLGVAVVVVEEINRRGKEVGERLLCPVCGTFLESKGLVARSMNSLIGLVSWKRRVWRCPQGCKIGQIAPLDEELGIEPNQRTSAELKQAACVLAVFVPFGIASVVFKSLFGLDVSPVAIWDWVQSAGKDAMIRLEQELSLLALQLPNTEELVASLLKLPLLIGGDGVMVPFRPHTGSAQGKTVWREVKVGIVARLSHRLTGTGKTVSMLVRRRVVAVLGTIDAFQARIG